MTARLIHGKYQGEERLARPEVTEHQREQDEWQRHLVRGVAEAIGRWLTDNGRMSRRVNQLTIEELEGIGCAATAEYVKLREDEWRKIERLSESRETKPLNQISDLSNV
jgi:hypothetical protein